MFNNGANILKYRKFSLICLFLSVPLNFIAMGVRSIIICIIGTSLLLIYIIMSLIFWRCPYCKEGLPMRFNSNEDINDSYICPYCNKRFE
jgi:hypothetical protein